MTIVYIIIALITILFLYKKHYSDIYAGLLKVESAVDYNSNGLKAKFDKIRKSVPNSQASKKFKKYFLKSVSDFGKMSYKERDMPHFKPFYKETYSKLWEMYFSYYKLLEETNRCTPESINKLNDFATSYDEMRKTLKEN